MGNGIGAHNITCRDTRPLKQEDAFEAYFEPIMTGLISACMSMVTLGLHSGTKVDPDQPHISNPFIDRQTLSLSAGRALARGGTLLFGAISFLGWAHTISEAWKIYNKRNP
jgi:hypothetical protein